MNEVWHMTDKEVIDNFHTAWKALAYQYNECPDDETRRALNLLKKMIDFVDGKVREEKLKEEQKEKQISLEEWINWFKEA